MNSCDSSSSFGAKLFAFGTLGVMAFSTLAAMRRGAPSAPQNRQTLAKVAKETAKILDLKEQHSSQMVRFREWSETNNWHKFNLAHYDWWMFPIARESEKYGSRFALSREEISTLKRDEKFMSHYREGVDLLLRSWGWPNCIVPGQGWTNHQVRLAKVATSLKLFEQQDLLKSVQEFSRQPHVKEALKPWVKEIVQ